MDAISIKLGPQFSNDHLQTDQRYIFEYETKNYDVSSLLHWKGINKKLTVFLPSALPTNQPRIIPSFLRWSWSDSLVGNVLVVDDPTIKMTSLHGGWFQGIDGNPTFFALLQTVRRVMELSSIAPEDVTFHGSSLGGFGSLILAASLPGSYAVAEVPQLDLSLYPVKTAIQGLEKECFNGELIDSIIEKRPHLLRIIDNFIFNKCVPNFIIFTNTEDEATKQHHQLMVDLLLAEKNINFDYIGSRALFVTNRVSAHIALGKGYIVSTLNNIKNIL